MIAGALLAAGASRRFPCTKQLADLNGRPLLEHALRAMTEAEELERVIVVLGANAPEILRRVRLGRATPVICAGWREGIAASLRAAVASLPGADPLVVAVGDQPGLTPAAIRAVLQALRDAPPARAARAVYAGEPGHPVAMRRALRRELLTLSGDAGAGGLLRKCGALQVDCSRLGRAGDVDTAEDLLRAAALR